MKNAARLTALMALLALITLTAGSASATETVSPGALDRLAVVETRCPTFSWGADDGAAAYDLVAYVLPEDAALQLETLRPLQPVLEDELVPIMTGLVQCTSLMSVPKAARELDAQVV